MTVFATSLPYLEIGVHFAVDVSLTYVKFMQSMCCIEIQSDHYVIEFHLFVGLSSFSAIWCALVFGTMVYLCVRVAKFKIIWLSNTIFLYPWF